MTGRAIGTLIGALGIAIAMARPAASQDVSVLAALSQSRVSITASFDGTEILVYGAVLRDAPDTGPPLAVIITVAGPALPVVVRRKARIVGVWMNRDAVTVDAAPAFYAVAASGPLSDVLGDADDLRQRITIPRAIRSVGAPLQGGDADAFKDALIRIRTADGLYVDAPGTVAFDQQTLFSTHVTLPANLTEGNYTTRIFLTRDGVVVAGYETALYVQKAGLERFLWTLAHERPLVYGLVSLAIAAAAGWGASAAFRWVRG